MIALWPKQIERLKELPCGRDNRSSIACTKSINMLTASAGNMVFSLGISERDVIERCRLGLKGEGAVVTDAEADWVVRRLTELLGW